MKPNSFTPIPTNSPGIDIEVIPYRPDRSYVTELALISPGVGLTSFSGPGNPRHPRNDATAPALPSPEGSHQ